MFQVEILVSKINSKKFDKIKIMKSILTKILNSIYKYKQGLSIVGIIFLLFSINFVSHYVYNSVILNDAPAELENSEYSDCNVQGILLRGDIYTYIPTDLDGYPLEGYEGAVSSEEISYLIGEAEYDDNIKAILIEVDSYGGSPLAGEEISNDIKFATKPVVVYIRESGVSAAYLAISSADQIFASKMSDVGSIGVTMSYLDYSTQNRQEGISFVQLSTGKFKDSGSPDKSITQEEKNLFMRDLNIIQDIFIRSVSENRNISIEKVESIADGSSVLGEQAIELDLIDQIGDYYSAGDYISELIGEEVNDCW